jgi:hypothetical protein
MAYRRWKLTEVFEGPVIFGADADTGSRDMTFYGATTGSKIVIDTSEDEMYIDGMDLWLKDGDQLEFGDSSDVVIDWETATGFQLLPAAAGSELSFGSSSYYWAADWNMSDIDIDLYGTNPDVNIDRNLTSGATNAPVVTLVQNNASDDQVTLKVQQDAAVAGVDFDCALDIDIPSTYNTGIGVDIIRNLTSGNTDNVVVRIKQDNASDDQAALQVVQDAAVAGVDFDCALDIDIPSGYSTGVGVSINRNLTSGATDDAVVNIVQDNASDDQTALKVDQDAGDYLAADLNGWVDLGYTTNDGSNPSSTTVPTGACRIYKASSNYYLAVHAGSGTYYYAAITTTAGGVS